MSDSASEPSLFDKLDSASPVPLAKFDAFPKLPSTYQARSDTRGFLTIFVVLACMLLTLNDVGEFLWGWPDSEFSVAPGTVAGMRSSDFMKVNLDMVVAMPCRYLNVDLRDALGDRLYLNSGFRRDGTFFDTGSAKVLGDYRKELTATEAVTQSRQSRGFFTNFFRFFTVSYYKPKFHHRHHTTACRIHGTVEVKKLTANLHITANGHGYASRDIAPPELMNMTHVIQEFSFGPYYPEINQPLDYTYELTTNPEVSYQYFVHIVPTTYIAPRSEPLVTNQYAVTHYMRNLQAAHLVNKGVPGIFFKFVVDPMMVTVHQRTISFTTLLIRCAGVIGGVFVCTGYAIRVGSRAVEVVTGESSSEGLVGADATGVSRNLREKWGGGTLRSRRTESGRMIRQGSGWVMEGSNSPYGSYANTPVSAGFGMSSPGPVQSPYLATGGPGLPGSAPGTPAFAQSPGFGPNTPSVRSPGPPSRTPSGGQRNSMYGPGGAHASPVPTPSSATFPPTQTLNAPPTPGALAPNGMYPPNVNGSNSNLSLPGTPMYNHFPASPNPTNGGAAGFPSAPPPGPRRTPTGKKDKED